MKRQEFIQILEDGLEVDAGTLSEKDRLADLECWDSMAALIFMSLAHKHLGLKVSGDQLASCKTVEALVTLVGHRFSE